MKLKIVCSVCARHLSRSDIIHQRSCPDCESPAIERHRVVVFETGTVLPQDPHNPWRPSRND